MKVSVCIPTVSRIAYLRETLMSVERQTFSDYEIVVSNNSANVEYTVAVEALLSEFRQLPIRVVHQHSQLSMVGNGNALIDEAQGEFWIYLPDDDRFTPHCLATLASALVRTPQAGFAFADHWLIDEWGNVKVQASLANTRRYHRDKLAPGFYSRDRLFDLALLQVFELQSMLFRTEVIKELRFREEANPIPDYDLHLRLWKMKGGNGAVYCPERVNEYRIHGGMVSAKGSERGAYLAQINMLEAHAPADARARQLYRRTLARFYAGLSISHAQSGDGARARQNAARAFVLAPGSPRVLATALVSLCPAKIVRIFRFMFSGLRRIATFLVQSLQQWVSAVSVRAHP